SSTMRRIRASTERLRPFRVVVSGLAMMSVVAACAPDTSSQIGGDTVWLEVEQGRLKTQVFADESLGDRPILVIILHGDIPDPRPDYQYLVAKAITVGWPDVPERSAVLRGALGEDW